MGDDAERNLTDQLEEAASECNFVKYGQLVNANLPILNGIVKDFWMEIFDGENRQEIMFWINYPGWKLNPMYLAALSPANDDLFYLGLNRPNLDLENLDGLIEVLEENFEEAEQEERDERNYVSYITVIREEVPAPPNNNKIIYQNRLTAVLAKKSPPIVISFAEAVRKLQNGDFYKFDFLPEYQNRKLNPNNYIATFYGKDEKIYLAELQYNQTTHQILPPL
jgi:hypothetical protein